MKFTTTILQFGNNTGIQLSENQVDSLGSGKKPLVLVTLNGYTYRSAVAKMGGQFLISLSSENRKNAGVKGGDTLEIEVILDTEPRTVEVPEALQAAFEANPTGQIAFNRLTPSKQKALVLSINDAKTEETRAKRVVKAIESLKGD